MAPIIRLPSGPITPHGAYHILHDRIPQMGLLSYDNTVVFHMFGGLSIADKATAPGRVEIKNLKGLIPPWQQIEQKGATQDGSTFVDALYDPIEVEMDTRIMGKDPADCRRVARYLTDSLDAKQESELFWFTHHMGRWWAKVRWFKTPTDSINAIRNKRQDMQLRLRAHTGFWESYPSVSDFVFTYADVIDNFDTDDPNDLGTGWTVTLSGPGSGGLQVSGGQAVPTLNNDRTAVARKNSYTSTTDSQVAEIELGTFGLWYWPTDTMGDIWLRMNNTGTPGTSGVRLRIKRHYLRLSYFVAGVETVIREALLVVPPLPGEKWRLIAGEEGNLRSFRVMRGGATRLIVKEQGTGSPVGASNRSVGFGMWSGWLNDPASIRTFSAGDNNTVSQIGYVQRFNVGDQPMWDTYTCFGPGMFRFWNGPNAGPEDYVEFGPLLAGQVMHIRTDPRKRGVVDLTAIPPTPQQLNFWQQALNAFLNFATGNNATPLAEEIKSQWGTLPPQGNPYSLLNGRFSFPIPPKSPGKVAQPYYVKVSIDDGDADSKIIASGTPLRRMPY